jgi:hypothetical protein
VTRRALIGTQLEASPPQNAIDCTMLSRFSRNREIPNFTLDWITDKVEFFANPLPLQKEYQ